MTPPVAAVIIVDDDAAVRDSLTLLLGMHGIAARAFESGEAFLAAFDRHWRGCVLLDLRMPLMSGLEVQSALAARGEHLPIVMLTAHGDVATTRQALKAGAFDFVEKPFDPQRLLATIGAAMLHDARNRGHADVRDANRQRLARLTARERQVFERVVAGRHNREIAAELDISPRTVEVYKARVMQKLEVDRLPDLVRLSLEADGGGSEVSS